MFADDSIHRLLNATETLIRSAAMDVGTRLGTLPLVDRDAAHELARAGGAERASADAPHVTDRVSQIAAETPLRVAIIAPDRTLTYGELDSESSVLAETLCELGVAPEDRVGIYVRRLAAMVVALLGAMKAGAADCRSIRITQIVESETCSTTAERACCSGTMTVPISGGL